MTNTVIALDLAASDLRMLHDSLVNTEAMYLNAWRDSHSEAERHFYFSKHAEAIDLLERVQLAWQASR